MDPTLWAIAIRGDSSVAALKSEVADLADVKPFRVPATGLRVGTLDSLMSLSDDLVKMEILAEATVTKMYKQLQELKPSIEGPTIIGVPVVQYTTMQWEWDEAKFQMKAPLRELSEGVSLRISALDEELKIKVSEVNALKGALQAIDRKTQGNLMMRGLADIVSANDILESEYMTTLFVVVPKANLKEFENQYEKMATYVVPKSGKLLTEDSEYGLFKCVIFKKCIDEFKTACRDKRYTMREFTYDANAVEDDRVKKAHNETEYNRLQGMLANWCHINYAECYTMMLHLKAVRVFTESVLRFGLTTSYQQGMVPNFKAFLLQPKKGSSEKLRKVLGALYASADSSPVAAEGEEEMVVPGAQGEFYPYVYTAIETEPNISL